MAYLGIYQEFVDEIESDAQQSLCTIQQSLELQPKIHTPPYSYVQWPSFNMGWDNQQTSRTIPQSSIIRTYDHTTMSTRVQQFT